METTKKVIKDKRYVWWEVFVNKPKYPAVDEDGNVWISDNTFLTHNLDFNEYKKFANKKEEKLYWRYHKAWKLLKK